MSLTILFHFLRAQYVSDINISIIGSLRLCCWITSSVVLFSVCARVAVVLQTATRAPLKTSRTKSPTHNDVVIQQHSRKLLMMDILMSETRWAHNKWNKIEVTSSWSFILQFFNQRNVYFSHYSYVFQLPHRSHHRAVHRIIKTKL